MANVVKDYDWCSLPKGSLLRSKAPFVKVDAYKLKGNNMYRAIQGYQTIFTKGKDADSFYRELYGNSEKAETYKFPFFTPELRSFGNSFSETFQDGVGGSSGVGSALNDWVKNMTGLIAQGAGAAGEEAMSEAGKKFKDNDIIGAFSSILKGISNGGSPGSYVETPVFYQYDKTDGPLNVSFMLLNTINSDSVQKNRDLVIELTKINRPLRKTALLIEPPRIYKIKVPGQRFIEWAYCSQFNVALRGTTRMVDGIVTPEAYEIQMTFQSLTLEHAGFMDQATPLSA